MPSSVASTTTTRTSTTSRSSRHHRALSEAKTEIFVNVYDLLPPGKLSSTLWTLGCALLHTGVVVRGKEYAFGGHERRGLTGVYFTRPKQEPPGGTYRVSLLQGFSVLPPEQIDEVITEVSNLFMGPAYNLLSKNCNHFTAELVKQLTGKAPPRWLNRAASIGVAFPCVVPKEWIEVPDFDDMGGELVDSHEESNERTGMIRPGDVERWRNDMDKIDKMGRLR